MARWLDDEEMRAWRGLAEAFVGVRARLEADLAPHGLDEGDYAVLVNLSESAGGAMRMCDLAAVLHLSPSGLTRRIDSMSRRGLVARRPSDQDRRVTLAEVTPTGRRVIEAAAPDHVEGVRRHFLDHLTRPQVRVLGDAMEAVARALDAEQGRAVDARVDSPGRGS
jgi:DNA-binding MarR family transcriptional regulator